MAGARYRYHFTELSCPFIVLTLLGYSFAAEVSFDGQFAEVKISYKVGPFFSSFFVCQKRKTFEIDLFTGIDWLLKN